jgi:hypothetical protein
MNPTDDPPRAVANWVSMVIQQLNSEQTEVLRTCLEAPGPDVRVVFCLRKGAVLLEVSNAGRRLELYCEDVTSGNRMSRRGCDDGAIDGALCRRRQEYGRGLPIHRCAGMASARLSPMLLKRAHQQR